MKASTLLILTVALATACTALADDRQAGAELVFSDAFFKNVKDSILGQLIEQIENLPFDDFSKTFAMALFDVNLAASEMKLKDFGVDQQNTGLTLHADAPNMRMVLKGAHIDFDFHFNVSANPIEIYEEVGSGTVTVTPTDMEVNFFVYAQDGKFQTEISDFSIPVDKFEVVIKSDGPIGKFINLIMGQIKTTFAAQINAFLSTALKGVVGSTINSMLLGAATEIVIVNNTDIVLDYTPVSNVSYTDEFMTVYLNGGVHLKGQSAAFDETRAMPSFDPDGKELQMFISDYTLSTLVLELHHQNQLVTTVPVTAGQIGAVIPEIPNKYGNKANIDIVLQSVDPDPKLQILNGETTLSLNATLPFYYADSDPKEKIVRLNGAVSARITFGVKEGPKDSLLLTGSIGDL